MVALPREPDRGRGEGHNADRVREAVWAVVGATPGGVYQMVRQKWRDALFGQGLCDLLVLDEASQMNLPEALMAALPLKPHARVIVVGDHRQMPPVLKHDWDREPRRTFGRYAAYESLFDAARAGPAPMVRFAESFRVHATVAEFLRREVYRHDGIGYHSRRVEGLAERPVGDEFVRAVLGPAHPLVVVTHGEAASQVRNAYERDLIAPVLAALTDPDLYALDGDTGVGVVVPHRAQRAALREAVAQSAGGPAGERPPEPAVDTVERFQGAERDVVIVCATQSDPFYLLTSAGFLLDPRRLTVALSRGKRKVVVVGARTVFELFCPEPGTWGGSLLWKNLLGQSCTELLWQGERGGRVVHVWGARDPDRV